MNKWIGISLFCACLLASGCGPSQDELNALATQEAQAQSATQTALAPTSTPTPTPTATPTPTPTPEPDASTMVDVAVLELPASYLVHSPDLWGIEPGAIGVAVGEKSYVIVNSFVFADEENLEVVFGYTMQLTDPADFDLVDDILNNYWDSAEETFNTLGVVVLNSSEILGARNIGDVSEGFRIDFVSDGIPISLHQVGFRTGDIFSVVIVKNYMGTAPSVAVEDVAKTYAANIQNPIHSCRIATLRKMSDEDWPMVDFQARGFYPGEQLVVLVDGEIELDGEQMLIGQANGAEDSYAVSRVLVEEVTSRDFEMFSWNQAPLFADNQGAEYGTISLMRVEGGSVDPPDQCGLTVFGLYSGCVATETFDWP